MMKSKYLLVPTVLSALFLLNACGEGDSGTASAPAMESAPAEMAEAEAPSDSGSSMSMEKAEGVVYQDEIYANWPYN